MKVIGLDIDGVLADFNEGYRKVLTTVTGKDRFNGEVDPPCWSYEKHYGYTEAEVHRAWEVIMADAGFWERLNPYDYTPALLNRVEDIAREQRAEVYFITSRPGVEVKDQTERWLLRHGYGDWEHPTVLIARGAKGPLAYSLGLTHFVDDRIENIESVLDNSPGTLTRLWGRRYNQGTNLVSLTTPEECVRFLED